MTKFKFDVYSNDVLIGHITSTDRDAIRALRAFSKKHNFSNLTASRSYLNNGGYLTTVEYYYF